MEEYREIPLEGLPEDAAQEDAAVLLEGKALEGEALQPEEPLESVLLKELLTSVSGNVPNTVSGNVIVDNYIDYTPLLTDMYAELQTLKKEEPGIFDKPLTDYTVTEGLLFFIFMLLLARFIGGMFKKGEHYV